MVEFEPTYDFDRFKKLSPRQLDVVLSLVNQTLHNTADETIGEALGVSTSTVGAMLEIIREKLGLREKPSIAVVAIHFIWRQALIGELKDNTNPLAVFAKLKR